MNETTAASASPHIALAVARGFGCHAERVANAAQLAAALERCASRTVPSVIEVDATGWLGAPAA